jgi:hypothetical protein
MIRGENVTLRTVRESDLDSLFSFLSDIANRGEFFPIMIPSEAIFKKDFRDTGFWQEGFGRLLICDKNEQVVGSIWYFKTASYYDGNRLSYVRYSKSQPRLDDRVSIAPSAAPLRYQEDQSSTAYRDVAKRSLQKSGGKVWL